MDAPVIKDSVGARSIDEKRRESLSVEEQELEDQRARDIEIYGEGVEFPTEEEAATLRRIADKMPISAFAIVLVELCERFAYYGLSGPFQNYLQNPLPPNSPAGSNGDGPAGALNLGQTAATGLQNMFSFLAYITPIVGGIIADAKWGRYKTITVFCLVYFVGLLIILLTSLPVSLRHGAGLPGWIVGAIIVAIGTGGIKSNVSPLVADQYQKTRMYIRTLKSGERVIVDPNVTITRIYNLFYWCINVGSLSSIATTELEHNVGFWAAFLLPTLVFIGTPIVLIGASKTYHRVPPRGSIVMETFRVWRIALLGFWSHPIKYIREARVTGMWDRAKPSYVLERERGHSKSLNPQHGANRWLTWDDAFVDEVKRTAKACHIFLFFPLYWIAYNQLTTNLVSMAGTMTLHGTPNDLFQNFDPIALIIFIPLMDIFIYPGLRRMGFVARPVFRIFLGFMFGSAAMIYSAVLQHFIYKTNPCGDFVSTCVVNGEPRSSSLTVWIQIPPYVLIALSEIFASITGLEYAYNKAPKRMKSLVMACFLFTTAIGNALNAALSPVAIDPKLVGNYTGIAIATFIAGVVFYMLFRKRDMVEEVENQIGKERRYESEETLTHIPEDAGHKEDVKEKV
jgi:POT family proton-dependent oligopeptide transporter